MYCRFALVLLFLVLSDPAQAGKIVVFFDHFRSSALDEDRWRLPTGDPSFIPRTQFRPPSDPPRQPGSVVRLRLDTFNPSALVPGDSFFGTEIQTRRKFERGSGLVFECRSRLRRPVPGGLVASCFSFITDGSVRDEITFELLTNDIVAGREQVLTNVFDDADFSQAGAAVFASVPGLDLTRFNTFKVDWRPGAVTWSVNGDLVRSESTTVPDEDQRIHVNFWAPDSSFSAAFDGSLQPASRQQDNQTFTYEVDFVRISIIQPPAAASCRQRDGRGTWDFTAVDLTNGQTTVCSLSIRGNGKVRRAKSSCRRSSGPGLGQVSGRLRVRQPCGGGVKGVVRVSETDTFRFGNAQLAETKRLLSGKGRSDQKGRFHFTMTKN